MKLEFKEKQKFNQWWLWLILLATLCIPLYLAFTESLKLSDPAFWVFTLISFGFILLFALFQLTTTITTQSIQVIFFPFVSKMIDKNEIDSIQVINYGFVGGWGIRLWTKYGTVYNVKGNIGLHVQLKNGKQFLIGTQNEGELKEFIAKHYGKQLE